MKWLISPEENRGQFGYASQNWKTNKPQMFALFLFIEGISIILKTHKVQLLQIGGYFVRTPHEQFK